jgi:hypothetical protein
MNIELLRKIAAVIQEKPAEFDMADFTKYTTCGTAHCIGGWAHVLTGGDEEKACSRGGRLALELSETEAYRLFYCDQWPPRFQSGETGWEVSPELAAARIEHFIATGGAE